MSYLFCNHLRNFSFACLIIAITSTSLSARIFTNTKGKSIDAKIVSVENNKVVLKLLKNKKEYTLDVDSLSEKDQAYIGEWDKSNKTVAESNNDEEQETTSNDSDTPRRSVYGELAYSALKKKYEIKDNFDKEWPNMASAETPDITIVLEDGAKKKYVYQSNNYEFICDVKLSKNVVNKFAHLFEATKEFCQAMPISMVKAHIPKGGKRYKILLFESQQSYFKNGGPIGSAGVYMSRDDIIMVPLTSLGVIKHGSGYRYDYKGANNTLPHEITHQLTNLEYFSPGSMGWFTEGLAEYVAMTDYRSGKFMIRSNIRDIKDAVTGFSKKTNRGRNIGEEFTAPDLKEFMTMSYSNFTANGNFNYGLGALITFYFLQLEDDRTNINAFLKALNEGEKRDDSLEKLLGGRTFSELEEDIAKAWKSKGVEITFK